MNLKMSPIDLCFDVIQVPTHEELVSGLLRAKSKGRWKRLLSHPYRTLRNRMGFEFERAWQTRFMNYPSWPQEIRKRLQKLPPDFITMASMQPDIACHLFKAIQNGRCKAIIECGSGISTAIIAMAIEDQDVRFYSLEDSEFWIERTGRALRDLGLIERVELIHSGLKQLEFAGMTVYAHDDKGLGNCQADLLLVDAPPAKVGRVGVLPRMARHLAPGAVVLLDDAARPAEAQCVEAWTRHGLATLEGYLVLGTGMGVLRKV